MVQLPQLWIERMKTQLRDEMPAFLNTMEHPCLRGIRMNPQKPLPELVVWNNIEESIPWEQNGYYLGKDSSAGTTVWHEAGAFYLQEPSAMIPGALMNARPGEIILDLCAAPGGKATQMGIAMEGRGLLVVNEPVEKRARILSRNIERMGIPNAIVTCERPDHLARKWKGLFDAVMVDAPCSGEGMFRREPETAKEWSPEQAEGCILRQREILTAAAELVRPGGRLIYSTCTFHSGENQEMVEWFLKTFSEYEEMPFTLDGICENKSWFAGYPHRIRGEGQFVARLHRHGSVKTEKSALLIPDLPMPDRAMKTLWELSFPETPEATHLFGNTLVHLYTCPPLKGIRVLRAGLHLGEIRGHVPIPDHAVAMAFPCMHHASCELTEEEASMYLAGETLERHEKGWVLVQLHGMRLGWAKGSEGFLRNHYPKGLRNSLISCELQI